MQGAFSASAVSSVFLNKPVFHRHQKYLLSAASASPAPWQSLIQQVAVQRYGSLEAPEVQALLSAWTSALAASTYSGYFSKFRKFADFCFSHHLSPLPASDVTVERYLGWLLSQGSVAAHNFPQYISAIRTVHRDLLLPAPVSTVSSLIVKGGQHLQKSLTSHLESFPLPAQAVLDFLHAGLCTSSLSHVRALAAVVVTFMFMARGSTTQGMLFSDLSWCGDLLTLKESVRKGHTHHDHVLRTVTVNFSKVPQLQTLLCNFQALQLREFGSGRPDYFWQLPGEDLSKGDHFSDWFALCVLLVPVAVPAGLRLHPHCTRKGSASAAFSLGVALARICRLGGWSLKSSAVWQYIDPTVQASRAAVLFFGWLLPPSVDSLLST